MLRTVLDLVQAIHCLVYSTRCLGLPQPKRILYFDLHLEDQARSSQTTQRRFEELVVLGRRDVDDRRAWERQSEPERLDMFG